MQKRTIFIWDIHWCYKEFKLLLEKLNLSKEDKVYLTWDLIDKWPKSYKVLKYIYKNKKQFKFVLWNNEINFLKYIETWEFNYNKKEIKKLKSKLDEKPKILDFLKNTPLYIEKDNFILIHAWLTPSKKLEEHTKEEITTIRDINNEAWYKQYNWTKKIIYWHWWVDWLRIRNNTVWLDTWCVYWKRLTAYILETGEIIQQNALDIYINVYKNENWKTKEI